MRIQKHFSYIQVRKVNVTQSAAQGSPSTSWIGYKHSKSGGTFTLKKITHSDVTMKSSTGSPPLSEDMNMTINAQGGIYVYYQNNDITQPKVICIHNGTTYNWYAAGGSATAWTVPANLSDKTPESVIDKDLNDATESNTLTVPAGTDYIIKLDKRPGATGSIQYRTKDRVITVSKLVGTPGGPVPDGYVRYTHSPGSSISNPKFKHNGFDLDGITGGAGVKAVYVYYRGGGQDDKHEFPLIVCVKTSTTTTTYAYHKRGNEWSQESKLNEVNPDEHEPQKEVPNN